MGSNEIKRKYLKFFEERGHVQIEPSPLVLKNDPSTLFTSAGMQPLIQYLKGLPHPKGKRLVDIQPSLRFQDIESVGDKSHTTYFEMLGNWSLGDYFKADQLLWCWEFFTKELGLDPKRLHVSVFSGLEDIPKDTESSKIWKKIGVADDHLFYYGVEHNWWSRSGVPKLMPEGEIGGPDSEIFYDFGIKHNPKYGKECHPNCQCGRFMEIGNSVFIQYQKTKDGRLEELPQKNVDFGGGLERITAAVNNEPDIFKIDIFEPVIKTLEKETGISYQQNSREAAGFRIIADHLRAAVAIVSEGIFPSNKLQGYILRRLIRRAITKISPMETKTTAEIISKVIDSLNGGEEAKKIIIEEAVRFEKILQDGKRLVKRNPKIDPFELYQSFGIPYEISREIFLETGRKLTDEEEKEFKKKLKEHQEKSRTFSVGIFKGGLASKSEETAKLHTATHLIHAALRQVLGKHVSQKGSNITSKRLRFDFSHPNKLSEEEIKRVENLVNEQIMRDLPVTFEEKTLKKAQEEGSLAFFGEKYGKRVKIYSIGDFSKEVCGGPHVNHTAEIGSVKIKKQEKVGSGIIRIYAGID